MKSYKYITNFALAISIFLNSNCTSILEPIPEGIVPMAELYTSESNIITAVNGIYNPLLGLYQQNMLRLTELAGDDGWTWRFETQPDLFEVDPTSGPVQQVWTSHYFGITRANGVLDNLSQVQDFSSEEMRRSIEGQAKFMRAFYYFNLVRFFGAVPLIVEEIVDRNDAEKPRSGIIEVYAQIKVDINDAIQLLPPSYSGGVGREVGRPTSNAAKALLSIVHLELEEWSEAVTLSQDLHGAGVLLANYSNNFNGSQENSSASFFEVQYGGVIAQTTTNKSIAFAPADFENGSAFILPTDDGLEGEGGGLSSGNGLIQAFEDGDLRKNVIVDTYGLSNFIDPSKPDGSLYYVNKYFNTSDPRGLSTWNFPLIRYVEILLNFAEALNELGFQADGEAFGLLNEVRENAGLMPLTSRDLSNQDEFREAVRRERRIELAFEAKRYFDLNRWGILADVIQVQMDYTNLNFPRQRLISHPITGKDYHLYPLPAIEFVNNVQLGEQNPGY
ncbi:MAG: RagB/SusD family nutrient uptake outer membrane protein [Lunatimonas sp.]|uniref:RagB/SusD family nutrient uptake outer membrane protein n=1 Tax=Lunatimonas sp. TaxID=2060141 RepID=UPI00263A522E|nr:RagB/SusD family nutrient uptake outer membrane protein [Lunatimonas sp.]MCC5938263.1 RagB/SusD family nutrient uptake outer membrane protein [Lunatimonas sp.]